MKRVAIVYLLAVFVPSLVLAWLALRSLRDQQLVLERQQSLLYQNVTDSVAGILAGHLLEKQREFAQKVEELLAGKNPNDAAITFDQELRQSWPLADVGFCVTLTGNLLSPTPTEHQAARLFCSDNVAFLGNQESVEVYWNVAGQNIGQQQLQKQTSQQQYQSSEDPLLASKMKGRAVNPKLLKGNVADANLEENYSKIIPAEAGFRELVGRDMDGTFARFLQDKLKVMVWHRMSRDPGLVFGAQLELNRVVAELRSLIQTDSTIGEQICVALLDERARPLAASRQGFQADWKRPFVSTEIGDVLPHWEVAAYLVNPAALEQTARTARLTLGLLIAVLVLAISIGGWLIFTSLNRELTLARQKTDFVSNVSHELKTPLTSIRMFSELLAERRVNDPAKQKSYLSIITAETARLTRLINNVLDFSRMERGERRYTMRDCDLSEIAREAVESYRPHLENCGFQLECTLAAGSLPIHGDCDALAQVIMNLLSNAEKYSAERKEITMRVSRVESGKTYGEVAVLDRGMGVPRGSEERIFEKFYRAHDSLSSGIQGSGLGLTLARQIASAHHGDVLFEPREGGGSCFTLRVPLQETS